MNRFIFSLFCFERRYWTHDVPSFIWTFSKTFSKFCLLIFFFLSLFKRKSSNYISMSVFAGTGFCVKMASFKSPAEINSLKILKHFWRRSPWSWDASLYIFHCRLQFKSPCESSESLSSDDCKSLEDFDTSLLPL